MRILLEEKNELRLIDKLSGTVLVVFYRMPTTQERLAYENGSFLRKGGKVVNKVGPTRRKFGLLIITGIGEDCFGKVIDGKAVPISSDPESEHYDKDWKASMEASASDVLEIMAARVFEASLEYFPAVPQSASDDDADQDHDDPDPTEENTPAEEDAAGNS